MCPSVASPQCARSLFPSPKVKHAISRRPAARGSVALCVPGRSRPQTSLPRPPPRGSVAAELPFAGQ
eukprot:346595-Lingulodinium_polyedra.AAC.1